MKRRKFFFVLIFLLLVGLQVPAWAATVPSPLWDFTGWHFPFPPGDFDIWVAGSPAVDDYGTIYAGSGNGYFFAIYPDGDLKWVNGDLGGAFVYTPAIADDGIVYASNGPRLFALDPEDGSVLWSTQAPCLFLGAPAIAKDGSVYVGSNSGRLYAFTRTLEKKWEFQQPVPPDQPGRFSVFANPVIGPDGTIYCLYTSGDLDPVHGNNKVDSGALCAIRPDGSPGPASVSGGVFLTDAAPAIAGGNIYVIGTDGYVRAFSTSDLKENWRSPEMTWVGELLKGPVIGADRTVYVPNLNQLYAFTPTLTKIWTWSATFYPSDQIFSICTPAIGADGLIYLGAYGNLGTAAMGILCALYPDGSLYWDRALVGSFPSSPAIVQSGNQGVLYIGNEHAVSAWNVDSPGIAQGPWPCDRANLKRNARASYLIIKATRELMELVKSYNFANNFGNSLVSKLGAAVNSLEKENVTPAKNQLGAFINEVNALKGKKIMARDADRLMTSARMILGFL